MRFCPFCASELSDDAVRCAFCGKGLPQRPRAGLDRAARNGASDAAETVSSIDEAATQALPVARRLKRDATPSRLTAKLPTPERHVIESSSQQPERREASSGDLTMLPAMPPPPARALLAHSGANTAADQLPPMQQEAPPGLIASLPYFLQVAKARYQRRGIVRAFRKEIDAEHIEIDDTLRELARIARQKDAVPAAAAQPDGAVTALEASRKGLVGNGQELDTQLAEAERQLNQIIEECNQRRQRTETEIDQIEQALTLKRRQQAEVRARLAEEEKHIKLLQRERDDNRTLAAKEAKADLQEDLQQLAAEKGVQIGDWDKKRAASLAELGQLRGPIEEAEKQVQVARTTVQELERHLGHARQQFNSTKRQIEAEKRTVGQEITRVDREIAAALMTLGRALDAQREDSDVFGDYFSRLDVHRRAVEAREQRIAELHSEQQEYDPTAYQRGMIVLGSLVASTLIILATILVLML